MNKNLVLTHILYKRFTSLSVGVTGVPGENYRCRVDKVRNVPIEKVVNFAE